jgi:hypothetical protein
MAIDDTDDPTKRKQRPNDPTGIPSPLTVDTTAPGGVGESKTELATGVPVAGAVNPVYVRSVGNEHHGEQQTRRD